MSRLQEQFAVFHTLAAETGALTDEVKNDIIECCRTVVNMEDAFIDLAFSMGPVQGMTAQDIKNYIRYIADSGRLVASNGARRWVVADEPHAGAAHLGQLKSLEELVKLGVGQHGVPPIAWEGACARL